MDELGTRQAVIHYLIGIAYDGFVLNSGFIATEEVDMQKGGACCSAPPSSSAYMQFGRPD